MDLFNGIILPDGKRLPFPYPIEKVKVVDITIRNHPAYNRKGSKQLVATELISDGEYIGSYGGQIRYFNQDDDADLNEWNPYQLTPFEDSTYYIDGAETGNEIRYINDPKGVGNKTPNVQFFQSDKKVRGFYVCDVYAIKDIQPGEELMSSYGDGYWEILKLWYEKENPFACPDCNHRYQTEKQLYVHQRSKNRSRDIFECEICKAQFKRKYLYTAHLNTHSREILYVCDTCEYETYDIYLMKDHQYSKHGEKDRWKCFHCDLFFATASSLNRHNKELHDDDGNVTCVYCEDKFPSNKLLKRHVVEIHEKKKPFKCELCIADFETKTGLSVHKKHAHCNDSNRLEKSFKCTKCDTYVVNEYSITQHLKKMHGDPVNCKECDYTAKDKRDLVDHVENDHKKDATPCRVCGKKFQTISSMYRHIREVHNRKRRRNGIADNEMRTNSLKEFKEKYLQPGYNPNDEIRTCKVCNKTFSQRGSFYRHVREVHKDKKRMKHTKHDNHKLSNKNNQTSLNKKRRVDDKD